MSFFSNLSELFNQPKGSGKKPAAKPAQPTKGAAPKPTQPAAPVVTKGVKPQVTQPAAPQINPAVIDNSTIVREAQSKAREIIIEAKDEALAIRSDAEKTARQQQQQLEEQQRNLDRNLDKIDFRLSQLEEKEQGLEKNKAEVEKVKSELETRRQDLLAKLEKISGMTSEEAKAFLMENLEKKLSKEMAQLIKQREEQAKNEADDKVREILVDAMKHGATDYVPEYTISTVQLPSEDIKGKIIGKSGRNIHTFEKVTGVDLDLDTSPTEVRLSCFNSVRREIARIALERLVKDGRIQPSRIEEVVEKVRTEVDKIMFEAGKQLCHEVGVYNLPPELMKMLGNFKFRFSYGQNLIAHTMEETKIGIKLAHELGANVNTVRLGCLLHDIGKIVEDEEGSHVELGVKVARKFGLPQEVIDCIEQHHEDKPFTGPEQMIVYIADAISGARPGARYENYEEYVQRLEKLEEIAMSYEGVREAYAIQAGREIRVLLEPERTKDDDVAVLAMEIKDRVKNEMTYPGTVTVNVSRETKAKQIAA
jgi:ribonucrease Y